MTLLLADDEERVRSALRLLLEQEPGVGAVDEVGEATSLLAKAQETSPDVVLLDWELLGLRDKHLLSELRARDPQLRVVAMSGRPEARQQAMGSGADAFVSKSDPPDVLLAELHAVLAGRAKKAGTNMGAIQDAAPAGKAEDAGTNMGATQDAAPAGKAEAGTSMGATQDAVLAERNTVRRD